MAGRPAPHLLLWVVLALPAGWLLGRWASGALVYGEVVSRTGIWAAALLVPVAATTPLRWLFPRARWVVRLRERREAVGAAAFGYAGVHAAAYLVGKSDAGLVLAEARQPWLLAGWAALLLFVLVAATTEEAAARALRRSWRGLHRWGGASRALGWAHRVLRRWHRLVYGGAALVFVHWALAAFDPLTEQVQVQLRTYGYDPGPIDGVIGSQSRAALEAFQRDRDLVVTGTITPEVLAEFGIVPN